MQPVTLQVKGWGKSSCGALGQGSPPSTWGCCCRAGQALEPLSLLGRARWLEHPSAQPSQPLTHPLPQHLTGWLIALLCSKLKGSPLSPVRVRSQAGAPSLGSSHNFCRTAQCGWVSSREPLVFQPCAFPWDFRLGPALGVLPCYQRPQSCPICTGPSRATEGLGGASTGPMEVLVPICGVAELRPREQGRGWAVPAPGQGLGWQLGTTEGLAQDHTAP